MQFISNLVSFFRCAFLLDKRTELTLRWVHKFPVVEKVEDGFKVTLLSDVGSANLFEEITVYLKSAGAFVDQKDGQIRIRGVLHRLHGPAWIKTTVRSDGTVWGGRPATDYYVNGKKLSSGEYMWALKACGRKDILTTYMFCEDEKLRQAAKMVVENKISKDGWIRLS